MIKNTILILLLASTLFACQKTSNEYIVSEPIYSQLPIDSVKSVITWIYSTDSKTYNGKYQVEAGNLVLDSVEDRYDFIGGSVTFKPEAVRMEIDSTDKNTSPLLLLYDSTSVMAKMEFVDLPVVDTIPADNKSLYEIQLSLNDPGFSNILLIDTARFEWQNQQILISSILSFPAPYTSYEIGLFLYVPINKD